MNWNVYTTTDAQWQKAIHEERKLGRSSHYITNAWSLMAASIEKATNHRPDVNLYPPESKQRAWLDHDEIDILVAAVKGSKYEIPVLLCLSSLRRSEMLGLRWSQVDFRNNVLEIRGATVRGPNGMVDKKQNKTKKSTRSVPIIPPLREALGTIRQEVKLCDDIAIRSGVMKEKIQAVREDSKNQGKESSRDEQLRRRGGAGRQA